MKGKHFNEEGRARLVDVGDKAATERRATAFGKITMAAETLRLIRRGEATKGDVLAVAQVAGILAAKKTGEFIPLCHPIPLTGVDIAFSLEDNPPAVSIRATVRSFGVTGVEMEALTAVSAAALTIYDMCKAAQRDMAIGPLYLTEKTGGESGDFQRED